MTWHLHCTNCNRKIFKTEIDPMPRVGAVLIAQHWEYMDGTQVQGGDRFFCESCDSEFHPVTEKVRKYNEPIN